MWRFKIHYRLHNSLQFGRILKQMNLATLYFFLPFFMKGPCLNPTHATRLVRSIFFLSDHRYCLMKRTDYEVLNVSLTVHHELTIQ